VSRPDSRRLGWAQSLPAHWDVVPLNFVAKMGTGHTPDRNKPEYWQNCTVPWVTTPDVTRRANSLAPLMETEQRISEIGMANSAAVLHPADTVMLSRTASIGYSVRIGRPMATTQAFVTWLAGPRLDPRYLLLVLRAMKQEWNKLAYGSTHLTIYMPDLESIRIPLPPLEEQRRIAGFLDAEIARLDRLTEARNSQRALLELRRWSYFQDALDRVPVKWIPFRRVLRSVIDGPFGSAFSSGDYVDEGAKVVRLGNIGFAEYKSRDQANITLDMFTRFRAFEVREGDVLIAGLGDVRNHAGRACVAPALGPAIVKGKCFRARLDPSVANAHFAALLLSSPVGAGAIEGRGSTRTMINLEIVKSSILPIPELSLQSSVTKTTFKGWEKMRAALDACDRQLILLAERRQALITAAVTGQIDVSTASGRGIED
jgi:type I restriction enzyme S subunit